MGQTNYLQSRFRLGILGEYSGDEIIDSYVCDVDLTLTTAVVQGADEPLCAPVDGLATAADIIGITVLNMDCDYYDETETIEAGASVSVARKGCFVCTVEGAVTKGAPVFVRTTAAGAEVLGALRGDADGGDAIALPGAQFGSTTTGAGLALVRLNLPQ